MEQTAGDEDGQSLVERLVSVSVAFEGSEDIAVARDMARSFLTDVQAVHGLPVSAGAMDLVQLVVSELVTNARKYAPGPCLLTLEAGGGTVEVSVWDSNPTPPAILPPDPRRVGQHGLEIVMAVGQSFSIHREPVGKRITTAIVLADDPGGEGIGR
jgi:anti-sigma regulatory factor (Ser/Thr protein kinase)